MKSMSRSKHDKYELVTVATMKRCEKRSELGILFNEEHCVSQVASSPQSRAPQRQIRLDLSFAPKTDNINPLTPNDL
jgi:hypothetical protein